MYQSHRSLNDFKWLVEDNPAGSAVLFIALIDDKVVGMQSLIPYVFVRNGIQIDTYKSEDTLVEKSLRGKGIFTKLYEMLHDYAGEKLVWGLTDKKEILERVNMPSSERLTISISVKRPALVSEKKGLHLLVAKTLLYSYLYFKSTFKTKKVKAHLSMKEINLSDYGSIEMQEFFSKLSLQNPTVFFPRMDADYLKWRLTDNPNLTTYKIMVSHLEDGAIAICSIVGLDQKSAHWQACYVLSEILEDEVIAHISSLRNELFRSGINLIHTWLFECNPLVNNMKEIFFKSGFSKVRKGLWIVHNSTDKEFDVHDLYFSGQLGIR